MSNLLYAKSFANQSGLTVDNISTTTINNITYNSNLSDVSGYITNLYSTVGKQSNYLNTLSSQIYNGTFGSITCGNITSTGTFNNGSNTLTCGAVNASGRVNIGDIIWINYGGLNANLQMTNYGYCHMNMPSSSNLFAMNCSSIAVSYNPSSDDRIKTNESLITDATTTLLKMRPEIYDKYSNFDLSGSFIKESGFVIQEVWMIPELRHLIHVPPDANMEELETIQSTDPNNDPNYNPNWGSTAGALNYNGLIAYLVKSIQELDARIKLLGG